jgi:hypothetical protein
MGNAMPMPEPKPEVLERPVNGAQSASTALPEGADPDPDQYLWGV